MGWEGARAESFDCRWKLLGEAELHIGYWKWRLGQNLGTRGDKILGSCLGQRDIGLLHLQAPEGIAWHSLFSLLKLQIMPAHMTPPHNSNKREVLSEVSFFLRAGVITHSQCNWRPKMPIQVSRPISSFLNFTQLDWAQVGYPCSPLGKGAARSFDFHQSTS